MFIIYYLFGCTRSLVVSCGIFSHTYSAGQNTGVGSCSHLQGIFPTQGLNQVSHIAGIFFTKWVTREAQDTIWSEVKWSEVAQSCPNLCNPVDCSLAGSSVHRIFPSKSTGVGCHFLLQEIFPTQGLNQVSHIAGGFFTTWTTREAPFHVKNKLIVE